MSDRHVSILQDTKAAIGTVLATIAAGLSLTLDWIPDDIGKLASLVGIIGTTILIYNHVRARHLHAYQDRLDKRAIRLEVLERQLTAAQAEQKALHRIVDEMVKKTTVR